MLVAILLYIKKVLLLKKWGGSKTFSSLTCSESLTCGSGLEIPTICSSWLGRSTTLYQVIVPIVAIFGVPSVPQTMNIVWNTINHHYRYTPFSSYRERRETPLKRNGKMAFSQKLMPPSSLPLRRWRRTGVRGQSLWMQACRGFYDLKRGQRVFNNAMFKDVIRGWHDANYF